MSGEHRFRCGDFVRHTPSGEEWVVAYADYAANRIAWNGYPAGVAEISDCVLVKAATDEEHAHEVRTWLKSPRPFGDFRYEKIRKLYPVECCGR